MLLSLYQKNPNDTIQDLNNALNVQRKNLYSFETLFKDNLLVYIERLKDQIDGKRQSNVDLNIKALNRLGKDYNKDLLRSFKDPVKWLSFIVSPLLGPVAYDGWQMFQRMSDRPDMYQLAPWDTLKRPRAGDLDAEKRVLGFLCMQSQSLGSRREFQELCKGTVLKGFYNPNTIFSSFDVNYDDFNSNKIGDGPEADLKRLCAVRDYHRRHFVNWLSIGAGDVQ
jgi:hypothetical protein